MIRRKPRETFEAAVWNVYHGTPAEEVRAIARALRRDDVSLILGQEFAHVAQRNELAQAGYRVTFHERQYVIAYDPRVWRGVDEGRGVILSETAYLRKGGGKQLSEAVLQDLRHVAYGKRLRTMSYHTPAHVQVREPAPNRVRAAIESALAWRHFAGKAPHVLFGGDDNVDEKRAFRRRLRAFRNRWTGLRQVQAPEGTHGRRKIDDFRIRGLRKLEGHVRAGGGDHRIHVRTFAFR